MYAIICLFYLTVVKVVKRYVRRYLNTVSSYILGEDVIENKWFKLFKQSVVCSDIFCCLA